MARVQIYTPNWLETVASSESGFVFPELAHALGFAACWIMGGLAMGSFEEKAVEPKNLFATLRRTWTVGTVSALAALALWMACVATGTLLAGYAATGFVTQAQTTPTLIDVAVDLQVEILCLVAWRFVCAVLSAESRDGAEAEAAALLAGGSSAKAPEDEGGLRTIDSGLLLGDIFVSGVVVPTVIGICLVNTEVYTPRWVALWAAAEDIGSAIPAHGAGLACCWLIAAVLSGAFKPEALNPQDLAGTLKRTWTTGALASGLLALSTAVGLYFFSDLREVGQTDFETSRRLVETIFDCLLDVLFSAICLTTWRLYFAGLL